jgi:hypothetical protein
MRDPFTAGLSVSSFQALASFTTAGFCRHSLVNHHLVSGLSGGTLGWICPSSPLTRHTHAKDNPALSIAGFPIRSGSSRQDLQDLQD